MVGKACGIRLTVRDYATGGGLGGVLRRNHFLPTLGIALLH
jgi:hypothetical protein